MDSRFYVCWRASSVTLALGCSSCLAHFSSHYLTYSWKNTIPLPPSPPAASVSFILFPGHSWEGGGQLQVSEFPLVDCLCSSCFDPSIEGNWVKTIHMPIWAGISLLSLASVSHCVSNASNKSPGSISNGYSPVSTDPETAWTWCFIREKIAATDHSLELTKEDASVSITVIQGWLLNKMHHGFMDFCCCCCWVSKMRHVVLWNVVLK